MDEIPAFIQFLASMGVGGVLAGFMFHVHNKTLSDHANVLRGYHEVEKGRTEMVLGVVVENTKQTTANTEVLKSLHKRLDKDAQE